MKCTAILLSALLLATSGCGSEATSPASASPAPAADDSKDEDAGLPAMPERYQKGLTRAFAAADAGNSPTMACTSVIGIAAGNPTSDGATPNPDAVRAFELCYVDASARYIDALLARIADGEAKDDLCARIASYGLISRTSLGSFAANVQLDVAALDRRLLERVHGGMAATCPDQIETLNANR